MNPQQWAEFSEAVNGRRPRTRPQRQGDAFTRAIYEPTRPIELPYARLDINSLSEMLGHNVTGQENSLSEMLGPNVMRQENSLSEMPGQDVMRQENSLSEMLGPDVTGQENSLSEMPGPDVTGQDILRTIQQQPIMNVELDPGTESDAAESQLASPDSQLEPEMPSPETGLAQENHRSTLTQLNPTSATSVFTAPLARTKGAGITITDGVNILRTPESSHATPAQEDYEFLMVESPQSPTPPANNLNIVTAPTTPETHLISPSQTIPSTTKPPSELRPKDAPTSVAPLKPPRRRPNLLREAIASNTTPSDFPPEVSNAAIGEVNGLDHPVTNGDVMKIVKRFQKTNHTNAKSDVDFVVETHPLFTLSTIFPAVVGAVQSRPRVSMPGTLQRNDIPDEALFIHRLLERSASRATWASIEAYYALYRLHMYIDTQAALLRQEGVIKPGTLGSHSNILVGRAVEQFMCLFQDMSFEALEKWKLTNFKEWVCQ
jgi:hypothetical protein